MFRCPRFRGGLAVLGVAACFALPSVASADLSTATAQRVTNTKGGKNQNPVIDRSGKIVVFTSNVDQSGGSITDPSEAFDHDGTGNDFAVAGSPQPICIGCDGLNNTAGNIFIWRQKKKKGIPANSVQQITFSTTGGFAANQFPDMNQRASVIAWDSDQDHLGTNADGNREIFLYEIKTGTMTQVTNTTGNGNTANRSVNLDDKGQILVFDSRADFSGDPSCTQTDGATPCANGDHNSEIMVFDRKTGLLTQVTNTTGNQANANLRARVSNDGRYVAFQSTRDFATEPGTVASCTLLDGVTPCGNDGNGEIMLFDRKENALVQVTNTTNTAPCSGTNPSERVEISRRGKYLTFQSKCEAQLNPSGCGECNGNDEVFLAEMKKKRVVQVTISDGAAFNRVPRISGSGRYIVFESNRAYLGSPSSGKTLYVLKRVPFKDESANGLTAKLQLESDATLNGQGIIQNPRTDATTINFSGGFNTTIEQFGVSTNGRYVAFDNKKGVGNQEIWILDRKS